MDVTLKESKTLDKLSQELNSKLSFDLENMLEIW